MFIIMLFSLSLGEIFGKVMRDYESAAHLVSDWNLTSQCYIAVVQTQTLLHMKASDLTCHFI